MRVLTIVLASFPVALAQDAPKTNVTIQTGRFQLSDAGAICRLTGCRIDTQTGRVWVLQNGTRDLPNGGKDDFWFWRLLAEDTTDAWTSAPGRPTSLPMIILDPSQYPGKPSSPVPGLEEVRPTSSGPTPPLPKK